MTFAGSSGYHHLVARARKKKIPRKKRRPDKRDRKARTTYAGQPSKLTPKVQTAMVEAIEIGAPLEKVCQLVGIGYTTHREWVVRGENAIDDAAKRGGRVVKELKSYAEYADAIKRAEGEFVKVNLEKIRDLGHSGEKWQAFAWLLERRFPHLFALLERHEISGPGGGPIQTKSTVERVDELTEEYLDRIEKRNDRNGAHRRSVSRDRT